DDPMTRSRPASGRSESAESLFPVSTSWTECDCGSARRGECVALALKEPALSPRELARLHQDEGRTGDQVVRTESAALFKGFVGSNAQMQPLFRRIESIATTRSNVLIVGESGIGKELVARAIHVCACGRKPFVPFNCAAINREMIQSELF